MRPSSSLSTTLAMAALAGLATVASGCGDELTAPEALVDSAEAEAVLRSADALPSLPLVIDRAGDPADPRARLVLFRAQELWAAGVADDGPAASARRRLAVRLAAPALTESLGPADWDGIERGLREWSATAEDLLQHIPLPRVDVKLADARALLDRAATADDERGRAQGLLLAGAELVETTPRFLARSLAAEADAVVSRAAAEAADREAPDLLRALRLKDWAARAVEEGEYLVAIQRAYYALQLVEAR